MKKTRKAEKTACCFFLYCDKMLVIFWKKNKYLTGSFARLFFWYEIRATLIKAREINAERPRFALINVPILLRALT